MGDIEKKKLFHTDQLRFPYFQLYDTLPKTAETPIYSGTRGLKDLRSKFNDHSFLAFIVSYEVTIDSWCLSIIQNFLNS